MGIKTPLTHPDTLVWPGENWFLYWKTSAALWEAKIAEFSAPGPIFVPIYWAIHHENPDQFDFGSNKPETDLIRLVRTFEKLGRDFVFLMPSGVLPFVTNGGFPSFVARALQVTKNGLNQVTIDGSGSIHQIYSIYEPRVYQTFKKFISHFELVMSSNQVRYKIMGLTVDKIEDGQLKIFEDDYSATFNQGLDRYTQSSNVEKELARDHYQHTIRELYLETIKEVLNRYYVGIYPALMLGGSEDEIFSRAENDWDQTRKFLEQSLFALNWRRLPSAINLQTSEKKLPIQLFFQDIMHPSFVEKSLLSDYLMDELNVFKPLQFVYIITNTFESSHLSYIQQSAIELATRKEFGTSFAWVDRLSMEEELEKEFSHSVYCFVGHKLSNDNFQKMAKLFFSGKKILFDSSKLDADLQLKFDQFILENSLKTQVLQSVAKINIIELGDGMILSYDGNQLETESESRKLIFFEQIFRLLQFPTPKPTLEDGLCHIWRSRSANAGDLNYQELRRLTIFNPTNYRLKAHVPQHENFAFLKVIDPKEAHYKSLPGGVDVELGSFGAISFEYGFFE